MKVIIASGFFNPITPGHVNYFRLARELGDKLVVIVNNDKQAELKRGVKSFQDEQFRLDIVEAIRYVDDAVVAIDNDITVCDSIKKVWQSYYMQMTEKPTEFIFAKGGDRMAEEIPERIVCEELGIKIVDGLGAKTHSSSDYIKK